MRMGHGEASADGSNWLTFRRECAPALSTDWPVRRFGWVSSFSPWGVGADSDTTALKKMQCKSTGMTGL
jgi:hypothetical protein